MSGDLFQKGQKVWVLDRDGASRPALYVGTETQMGGLVGGEVGWWLGAGSGAMRAYVVFEDTRTTGQVEIDRIVPRDEGAQ